MFVLRFYHNLNVSVHASNRTLIRLIKARTKRTSLDGHNEQARISRKALYRATIRVHENARQVYAHVGG